MTSTRRRPAVMVLAALSGLLGLTVISGCAGSAGGPAARPSAGASAGASAGPSVSSSTKSSTKSSTGLSAGSPASSPPGRYSKVMVIAEENKTYDQVLTAGQAPYLETLAARYANATAMDAGYPPDCPSLAAYLLMTSGRRDGVCDDAGP